MFRCTKFLLTSLLVFIAAFANAQQVNSLYFLENAPMRHTVNPAMQPVSRFYLTLPALGYTNVGLTSNGLTLDDLLSSKTGGKQLPYRHLQAVAESQTKQSRMHRVNADAYVNILGFGFRVKERGYFHLNIAERVVGSFTLSPTALQLFQTQELADFDIPTVGSLSASAFTDFSLGYSHRINHQWSVGGKLKLLVGHLYTDVAMDKMMFTHSSTSATMYSSGSWSATNLIVDLFTGQDVVVQNFKDVTRQFLPGIGAALDFGFTYRPIEELEFSASVTDLGFLRWKNSQSGTISIDETYNYSDYVDMGDLSSLDTAALMPSFGDMMNAMQITTNSTSPITKALNANLNVGVDVKFWEDRVGLGLHSSTRFRGGKVNEELTLGAFLRPANWINLAATYSIINGKWSTLGAAIGLATYDGIMFTLSADYIPLNKANYNPDMYYIPHKSQGLNLALGMAIVVGTNNKKQ